MHDNMAALRKRLQVHPYISTGMTSMTLAYLVEAFAGEALSALMHDIPA
jgi:hypothetical protein